MKEQIRINSMRIEKVEKEVRQIRNIMIYVAGLMTANIGWDILPHVIG